MDIYALGARPQSVSPPVTYSIIRAHHICNVASAAHRPSAAIAPTPVSCGVTTCFSRKCWPSTDAYGAFFLTHCADASALAIKHDEHPSSALWAWLVPILRDGPRDDPSVV